MGASSSGLLDETKISHVKGLVDSVFQSFGVFYRQQYSAAYFCHLHQEVEPRKEEKGLLLTHRTPCAPDEVLYQGNVRFSCWYEHGKKSREKCIVLRRNYKVEIHENMETYSRGSAAKLVLQPAGGSVLTTEEESRAYLEQTCAGILNGAKEDSSLVAASPDAFAVYLHLPYTGHPCFLFKLEEERDHFLSALNTCIRHQNLDPWCKTSYETQAYTRALQLYLQDRGPYEFWERLLGTEEQVLASQVMEEVLPWLQSQLQPRLRGKKTERIRQWFATVQATYALVLDQLTTSLEALREECRQAAAASQALIRANLDQIIASRNFLEQKVRACICEEAEKECSELVAPFLPSILEALTENISAGIQEMRDTFHTQMDSAFTHTNGDTAASAKALSTLGSISLDQCYRQVAKLKEKLEDLQQRFGLSSTQKLVHAAHLEMEQLLDSAVYTLELFLQSSVKLQPPPQTPVNMDRAKGRVLKQLDYDSRVVQRRLYQEAVLEITLPALTKKMDSKWRSELQQFEQYIFSDYSGFVQVRNVYDEILRNLLSKEIETVVRAAASRKSNNLLLDTSDLAISQYSLVGQTPPRSAPDSPTIPARDSSANEDKEAALEVEKEGLTVTADVCPPTEPEHCCNDKSDPSTASHQNTVLKSPVIVVTQELDDSAAKEEPLVKETSEEVQLGAEKPSSVDSTTAESSTSDTPDSDAAVTHKAETPEAPTFSDLANPIPDLSTSTSPAPQSTDVPAGCAQSAAPTISAASDQISEDTSNPPSCCSPPLPPHTAVPIINIGSLSEAIGCSSTASSVNETNAQQTTDRAVYLTGDIKDNWELERVKVEKENEGAQKQIDETEKRHDEQEAEENGEDEEKEDKVQEVPHSCQPAEPQPEGSAEPPLGNVSLRDLVLEITEVEEVTFTDTLVTLTTVDPD